MRENRPSGSEGGVPRQRGIPTPIESGTVALEIWVTRQTFEIDRHPCLTVSETARLRNRDTVFRCAP